MKVARQFVEAGELTSDKTDFPQNVDVFFSLPACFYQPRSSYTDLVPRGKRKAQPPEMANSDRNDSPPTSVDGEDPNRGD